MRIATKLTGTLAFTLLILAAAYLILTRIASQKTLRNIEYAADIQPVQDTYLVSEGKRVAIGVELHNQGQKTWEIQGQNACLLSYHLLDSDRNVLRYDNRRFPLPQTLAQRQKLQMEITVVSPLEAGEYVLEFDLLREGQAWFKSGGSHTAEVILQVEQKEWPDSRIPFSLDYGKYTRFQASLPGVEKLYRLIRLTLEHNEVEFQGKATRVFGFSPGTDYPQIWLRDANTILPASRFFYDRRFLSSWIEEHLAFQTKDGGLNDWIDARGETDKNTTETDQETSAVQAAYQVYLLLGSDWLSQDIQGMSVLSRLERAMKYVLAHRSFVSDNAFLLTGAHTADWGDVDIVDTDGEAVYVDDRTHWTADIYDQSMFYQACLYLSEMLDATEASDKSIYWLAKAKQIERETNRLLWQKDKGFFRIHNHLSPLEHSFSEDDIFAMGGNTQAIIAGLANREQTESIIKTALERQATYNLSTISGTLLPPYPAGTFAHPMLDDPYEYQNGAQWDWFGGKLIYSMFESGFSREAKKKLVEVIHKNLKNRGFFEWDNREGVGLGSDLFSGSAGSLALAVIQGYFGVKPAKGRLSLAPKLGADSARIHVYQPADDSFVAYEYRFDPDAQTITFRYNSNIAGEGKIRLLSPWELTPETLKVTLGGKTIPYAIEKEREDVFIAFSSGFENKSVIIQR